MKKTEQKVLKFIADKNLLKANDKVLIGLSGGPDSVFLLYFLKKYSGKFKITLGAVHINHLLRGDEAEKDEKFCRNLAQKLSVPFYSFKENVKAAATKEKISLEEAGRKIRYKKFTEVSESKGYNKIATAHNADENAETVLLNLIKGAGIRGLSGIPPCRNKIVRPLLILTKQEIIDYLKNNKIKYRTDLSNLADDAERNFLRNQVIPLVKKRLNPSLSNTLFKSSEIFRNHYSLVKKEIEKSADKVISTKDDHLSLSLTELKKIDREFRGEVLRYIFENETSVRISFDDCSKVYSLINKQTGRSIELSGQLKVLRDRDELIVTNKKDKNDFKPVAVSSGDSVKINNKELSIKEIGTIKRKYSSNKNLEFIDGENTTNLFIVRKWNKGDRFYPLGMKGSKKISDFLSEQKISPFKKKEQVVLTNQDRIVWVVGLRLDQRFRVTPETKKIYKLCLS